MQARTGRNGWSDEETRALMDAARAARSAGRPLREVFESAAFSTGRKPNSIRNYYYACSRSEEGARRARFEPFRDDEAETLAETILAARACGQSVRACVMNMAGGDQKLMLRLQNKYRAMLRTRPDIINRASERLSARGITPPAPRKRPAHNAPRAYMPGDARVADMMNTLSELIDCAGRYDEAKNAARDAVRCICRYAALQDEQRAQEAEDIVRTLDECAARIERAVPGDK